MESNNAILLIIFILFLGLGLVLPIVSNEFNSSYEGTDSSSISDNVGQINPNVSDLSLITYLKSIIFIYFFTFGQIPFWLDIIVFVPLRLIFFTILIDKARGI